MKYHRLVCPAPQRIALAEYRLPDELAPEQLLLRNTHGAEKHGTMEAFVRTHGNSRGAWDAQRQMHTPGQGLGWEYPIPLGNMQVGRVEMIGSAVTRYKVGDRVLIMRGFEPWSVMHQRAGWQLSESADWRAATLLDPASYALSALRDANARAGDAVAIFSLGAIGLTAVALAKHAGCHPVVAIDPVVKRRTLAEKLGADLVLDPLGIDVGERLREVTGWRGVDVVLEYSGSVAALNSALRGVAFGGNVVCGAFPAPYGPGIDFGGEAHVNRPNIIFSRTESDPNRDHPRWDLSRIRATVLRWIEQGVLSGAIVDPIVHYDGDFAATYEKVMADKANAVKLGVTY